MDRSIKFFILLHALLLVSCSASESPNQAPNDTKSTYRSIVPKAELKPYQVAFLIMDGVYNTELTAPYDIFHHTVFRDSIRPMHVFTVANASRPVITFEGLSIIPDYNYLTDSIPAIDILVIPSAEHHLDTDLADDKMLEFVHKASSTASFVTSHCDGAFVLAKAGLLDGHSSTTFPSDINAYRRMFPHLDVKEDVLFVHDDKFITSAGGAKSFEASLYLCEILYGHKIAQQLASGLVIDWDLNKIDYYKKVEN